MSTSTPAPLHHSGVATFRNCEAQWAYEHVERLEPRYLSVAPTLGTWVHAALAADDIEMGMTMGTLLALPDELDLPGRPMAIYESVDPNDGLSQVYGSWDRLEGPLDGDLVIAAAEHWWNREADQGFIDDFTERYRDRTLPEHLRDIRHRYWLRWGTDRGEDDRDILLVEAPWRREIPGTDYVLEGRIDRVTYDRRLGLVTVSDRKTHKSWPSESQFVQDLMSSQLHLYAWGVAPLVEEAVGRVPSALEWDRIRTKPPTTPQLTKAGKLSKSVTDFDLPTYVAWVDSEPTYEGTRTVEPGTYEIEDEVVADLSTTEAQSKFFMRRRFPINESVIRRHVLMALQDGQRMAQVSSASDAPRSVGRHCSWCDFVLLCHAEMFGEVGQDDQFNAGDYNLKRMNKDQA